MIDPRKYTKSDLRESRFDEKQSLYRVYETEARKKLVMDVQNYIDSPKTKALALRGPVGGGKSFSLVYIIDQLKATHDNYFIFYINDSETLNIEILENEFMRVFEPFVFKHKFKGRMEEKENCRKYLKHVFDKTFKKKDIDAFNAMKSEILKIFESLKKDIKDVKFILVWDQINAVLRIETFKKLFRFLASEPIFDKKIVCASDNTPMLKDEGFLQYHVPYLFTEQEAKEFVNKEVESFKDRSIFIKDNLEQICLHGGLNPYDLRLLIDQLHDSWSENKTTLSYEGIFRQALNNYERKRLEMMIISHDKFLRESKFSNEQLLRFIENVYCMDLLPVANKNTAYIDHNLMCLDSKSFIYSACPLAKQLLYEFYPATMFDLRRIENLLKALKELLKLRTGAPQGWDWEFYFGLCLQRAFFRENNLKLVYEIYKKTDHILDSDNS